MVFAPLNTLRHVGASFELAVGIPILVRDKCLSRFLLDQPLPQLVGILQG